MLVSCSLSYFTSSGNISSQTSQLFFTQTYVRLCLFRAEVCQIKIIRGNFYVKWSVMLVGNALKKTTSGVTQALFEL